MQGKDGEDEGSSRQLQGLEPVFHSVLLVFIAALYHPECRRFNELFHFGSTVSVVQRSEVSKRRRTGRMSTYSRPHPTDVTTVRCRAALHLGQSSELPVFELSVHDPALSIALRDPGLFDAQLLGRQKTNPGSAGLD